jgi:hypothetical protein
VLGVRRDVEEQRATLTAVTQLEGAREQWTDALALVFDALPASAYLVSVRATGTEVRMSGLALSGHELIPALAAAPRVRDVALTAPLRREGRSGLEQFEARLAVVRRPPAGSAVHARVPRVTGTGSSPASAAPAEP